ncbi:MAG: SdrD B-like domain-containing protein, partial [Bacteroidota bacterium]
ACPGLDPITDVIICNSSSYTLPPIQGTDLTGNEAYYTETNGEGTRYEAGDAFPVSNTTVFVYDAVQGPQATNSETVANFLLNGNVSDASGNNTPTIGPSFLPTFTTDAVEGGQAGNFAGTGQITWQGYPGSPTMPFAERTITMSIKTSSVAGIQVLYEEGNQNNGFALRINNGILQVGVANGGTQFSADGPITLQTDTWYEVYGVFDNGVLTAYIDGVAGTPTTASFGTLVADAGILGRSAVAVSLDNYAFSGGANNRRYNGLIDNIRILTIAESPEVICFDEQSFEIIVPQLDLVPTVACANGTDFTVSVVVDWSNVDFANEDISLSVGGQTRTVTVSAADGMSTEMFTFTEPASGIPVNAAFTNTPDCSAAASIDLVACTPDCPGTAGTIGGNVFNDFDNNGADAGAGEVGQSNVRVEVYDCDGMLVCDTWTNADGNWSCDGLTNGEEYRVEFATPLQDYLVPSFAGTDNGTNTQLITAPSCLVNYGVVDPAFYCQEMPRLITTCFVNGNTQSSVDALVTFAYNSVGISLTGITNLAGNDQIGTMAGVAYARKTQQVYMGAFLKRHVGLLEGLPGNPLGRIMVKDMNGANATSTGGVTQFINLEDYGANVGTIPTNADRDLAGRFDPSHDDEAYTKIGKVGIGDVEISADERFLYAVSLNDKQLFTIEIDADNDPTTAPAPGDVTSVTIPRSRLCRW